MMKLHKFFPKLVAEYEEVCIDLIPSFIEEIELLSKNIGTKKSSLLNVQSSHRSIQSIHRLPAFKPLSKKILENAKDFMRQYGYEEFLCDRLFITNMWFNISYKGNFLFPHTHGGALISGAYYLETDPSHYIMFHDMNKNILEPPSFPNELNQDTEMLPCTPGNLYLFSSDFHHSVLQQTADARKIVISVNLSLEDGPKFR